MCQLLDSPNEFSTVLIYQANIPALEEGKMLSHLKFNLKMFSYYLGFVI